MEQISPPPIEPPSILLTLTEGLRIAGELTALLATWNWLRQQPKGDGHPVLVLPGFTAGDASTLFLRRFLRELEYEVLPWDLGTNTGESYLLPRLYTRINTIIKSTDAPFSIIGQSLGGVFARELARSFPSHVRSVITLGSPFRTRDGEGTNSVVRRMFERSATIRPAERVRMGLLPDSSRPPPVPSTAIYSRSDGVVAWQLCREYEGETAESVEVFGSHTGMSLNPLVFWILADRLAQPEGGWQKLDRDAYRRAWWDLSLAPVRNFPRMQCLRPLRSGN